MGVGIMYFLSSAVVEMVAVEGRSAVLPAVAAFLAYRHFSTAAGQPVSASHRHRGMTGGGGVTAAYGTYRHALRRLPAWQALRWRECFRANSAGRATPARVAPHVHALGEVLTLRLLRHKTASDVM